MSARSRRLLPALLVLTVLVPLPHVAASATCPSTATASDFDDTDGSAHEATIDCVVMFGVASGRSSTVYAPHDRVTRAQMATFLDRAMQAVARPLPEPTSKQFRDTDGGPHESAIERVAAAGITTGTKPGVYSPSDPVSRAQMATFLVRTYEWYSETSLAAYDDHFTDDDDSPHELNINKAKEAGLVSGTTATTYSPRSFVSRGQMASFLTRLLGRVYDGASPPVARILADPAEGEAPLDVRFDAGASTDDDGYITSYTWDFGDGTTVNGVTTSRRFSAGSHTVTLTVVDNSGARHRRAVTIEAYDDDRVTLPDLSGWYREDAYAWLESNGLQAYRHVLTTDDDPSIPEYTVLYHLDHQPGDRVPLGTVVKLVSKDNTWCEANPDDCLAPA